MIGVVVLCVGHGDSRKAKALYPWYRPFGNSNPPETSLLCSLTFCHILTYLGKAFNKS